MKDSTLEIQCEREILIENMRDGDDRPIDILLDFKINDLVTKCAALED